MTPEKRYTPSSVFTVRLGFGSVLLAAVITFVGLAWVFFLGVMVGRMYYGVDNTKQPQTPPAIEQSTNQKNTLENTIANVANPTAPAQGKSRTTYTPVVKEDTRFEKITQAQNAYSSNDLESTQDNFASLPSDVKSADNDENFMQNEKSAVQENSVSEAYEQCADFIEKVEENTSPHDEQVSTTTSSQDTTASDISEQKTAEPIVTESSSAEILSPKQEDSDSLDDTVQVIVADTSTTTETSTTSSLKEENNTVYIYTYQLGTFTVAENATAVVEKLIDDGVNATVLSEEKNGSMLSYVFAYHTGTESSQQLVQEKFVKHGLANFIVRRKTVQ